jgi:hypothetical protein
MKKQATRDPLIEAMKRAMMTASPVDRCNIATDTVNAVSPRRAAKTMMYAFTCVRTSTGCESLIARFSYKR